ncbi:hypothetical protein LR48_Vigan774s000900 [Vigna angularis]|uniref:Uncharacterized protein n=1 Tax=Phaseolus angularis TaxID=3914 RepID=A0A0L9TGP7_PHAAN|nr:hypothetical protein LR48_Vigan774s000900 [Vigna angularis]
MIMVQERTEKEGKQLTGSKQEIDRIDMARTRGGSSSHCGESSSLGERWRPTTSARRRRGAVESDVHVENAVDDHAFEEHDIE